MNETTNEAVKEIRGTDKEKDGDRIGTMRLLRAIDSDKDNSEQTDNGIGEYRNRLEEARLTAFRTDRHLPPPAGCQRDLSHSSRN